VRSWNLHEIETPGGSRSPVVLDSDEAARTVLIGLDPGQELGEHQVKEHAFVLVVGGSVRVDSGGESLDAQPGTLFTFEPDERRRVASVEGARILLFLAPWPGLGHYRGDPEPAPEG
jgi:quercetin dioxygenase-like cupin family protein